MDPEDVRVIRASILVLLACAILCLWRVVRGPTLLDRLAAADAIGVMFTGLLVLLAHLYERDLLLDVAMVYALLLFADVLIIARHIEHGGDAS